MYSQLLPIGKTSKRLWRGGAGEGRASEAGALRLGGYV